MPLYQMSQEPFRPGIQRASGTAGVSWSGWAKEWAVLAIIAVTLLALFGIAAVAMVFALSERKELTELSTHTANRLNDNDREVAALASGLAQVLATTEASRPDFPKRVVDLLDANLKRALESDAPVLSIETAAAIAHKARELKIDVSQQKLSEIGLGFLSLVEDENPSAPKNGAGALPKDRNLSGPAIQAVGEVLSYRSYLLASVLDQPPDGATTHNAMLRLSKLHSFVPLDLDSRIFGSMQVLGADASGSTAAINLLNRPDPMVSEDYRTLVVDRYNLKLDGLDARNVVFRDSHIVYSGEPVALDNVRFSNCTFELTPQSKAFASAALNPSGQVGVLKR